MPYIIFDERGKLASTIPTGLTPGQINFIVSDILDQYVGLVPNYDKLNSAIGILECAKQELYRRLVVPYETKKMEENGDVYMERET